MAESRAPGVDLHVGPPETAPSSCQLGDRLAGFSVLLPADPGRVGLLVEPAMAGTLRHRFTDVVDLTVEPDAPVTTLVVDERLHPGPHSLAVRPETVVRIGARGPHVLYPSSDHPQMLWRAGWPLPDTGGIRRRVRRVLGVASSRMRGVPRIEITGGAERSLADEIATDLADRLGERVRLIGVITAGHTVLRLRCGSRDVAVRLSCTNPGSEVMSSSAILRDVPALAPFLPAEIARGRAGVHPWVATEWFPADAMRLMRSHRTAERCHEAFERIARVLDAAPTGTTGAGWASTWVGRAALVPPDAATAYELALRPLEDGLPTGWCHGDPWPGNVLLGRADARVIDWDNAVPDAPLGIDRILATALRIAADGDGSMGSACASLARDPSRLEGSVAGRPWPEWDDRMRAALALAAFLLYLRNRDLHGMGAERLRLDLEVMTALSRGESVETPTDPEEQSAAAPDRASARGAFRGALWLGLGATTVKASQTVVLLALAALLAPSAMGLLAVGSLVLNVSAALTDLGSSTALVHWRGRAEEAARSALTLALGLSLLLTTSLWLAAPSLAHVLNVGDQGAAVIRGLLLALPFSAVAGVSGELLRREFAFVRRVVPDIVSAVLGSAVALVLALDGRGVYALVVGQVIQSALSMLLCWVVRPPVRPGWRFAHVRALVAYGGHLAGANLVQLLMLNVDYLLVAHVLGAGPLGQYSLAFRLAYMPHLLVAVVIGGAVFPYLCRMRGNDVGRATATFGAAAVAVLLPMYLGLMLLAPQIELLGAKWAPAVPVLRWLAGYGLLLSLVRMCMVPLNAVGRTRDSFLYSTLHLLLLSVVLTVLTPHGVVWVSIGQVLAVVVVVVLIARAVQSHVPGFRVVRVVRSLVPVVGAAALMVVVTVGLQRLFPWTRVSATGLALVGTLAVLSYAAVLLTARSSGLARELGHAGGAR